MKPQLRIVNGNEEHPRAWWARRLPDRFAWTFHNIIAHPLSEIFFQFGLRKASNWIHDVTIPHKGPGGRG